jgi:SAM-dependent methyltransferase
MTVFHEVTAFVRAALPPPPARVLEVGAGSGWLAVALREAGYEVVAVDPAADGPGVLAVPLLELDEPDASFDAAAAVVSLHHVEPLAASCDRLAALVKPGGVLAIDEFDIDRFDERAARWQLERREDHHHHADPAETVAHLRGHLHGLGEILGALRAGFAAGEPVRGAYLYRWGVPPGLRVEEEEWIAAGRLPATGVRVVGRRR